MKHKIFKLSIVVLFLFFIRSGCDKEEWIEAYLLSTTCLNNIKTVATYTHQERIISRIPNVSEEAIYILFKDSSTNKNIFLSM